MKNEDYAYQAFNLIKKSLPQFEATVGLILGSGLGNIANQIEAEKEFSYQELPGFLPSQVLGHASQLKLGRLNGANVVCMTGRSHFYEGKPLYCLTTPIRLMKLLGVKTLILTNAAGSMNHRYGLGQLVAISDHINFQFNNPLVGPNDDQYGDRFPPMDNAYDKALRDELKKTARQQDIKLHEGIYVGVLGPSYETAAEIEAFRRLGGDMVGMSTVSETILARHAGIKVVAISTITNFATGMKVNNHSDHNHESVLRVAAEAAEKLKQLLCHFIERIHAASATHSVN